MKKTIVGCVLLVLAGAVFALTQNSGYREISLADLRDKIEGGWAGSMIGVSYGAPTEFKFNERIIKPEELPVWKPEMIENSLDQDDLYVDMTFAQVLDDKGLKATTEDFGAMFKDAKYRLWHANLAARRALKRGVPASLAGTPKYNAHANDIDFQIEADFIGLMAPGMPRSSNDLCWRAGRLMNTGDGIYGGMFISGMYSAAYFEKDPRKVVEAGLATIPPRSPYAMLIRDVLDWSAKYPSDWMKVWHLIEEKWNKREPCPEGAMKPFNIDAKLNGAYVALGLLYGGGDFDRTLEVSTRAGQDSDCNPASACGVLGTMIGYKRIPGKWKSHIPAIADRKFNFTQYTFRTIVDSTQKRAIALASQEGGRLAGDKLMVKVQTPTAAKLEVWDNYGSPVERVPVADARWKWKGEWQDGGRQHRTQRHWKIATSKGAEVTVSFDGTGAILVGPFLPTGGKAEVYLNGKLSRVIDAYPDEANIKHGEALWHEFGLRPGKHEVRLVVLGEPMTGSAGKEIALEDMVVLR